MADRVHWDERYRTIGAESVSWFEESPTVSLDLFDRLGVTSQDSVMDIGGGVSRLVDNLLDLGHERVGVLDVSKLALDSTRRRIADPVGVEWINCELLSWQPTDLWSVWHDRAVLHFLTDDADRAAYARLLWRTLEPGGAFVIGVFAEDGPTQCSALPVRRYSPDELRSLVGDVDVVTELRQVHRTPTGVEQPFNWLAGRLRQHP